MRWAIAAGIVNTLIPLTDVLMLITILQVTGSFVCVGIGAAIRSFAILLSYTILYRRINENPIQSLAIAPFLLIAPLIVLAFMPSLVLLYIAYLVLGLGIALFNIGSAEMVMKYTPLNQWSSIVKKMRFSSGLAAIPIYIATAILLIEYHVYAYVMLMILILTSTLILEISRSSQKYESISVEDKLGMAFRLILIAEQPDILKKYLEKAKPVKGLGYLGIVLTVLLFSFSDSMVLTQIPPLLYVALGPIPLLLGLSIFMASQAFILGFFGSIRSPSLLAGIAFLRMFGILMLAHVFKDVISCIIFLTILGSTWALFEIASISLALKYSDEKSFQFYLVAQEIGSILGAIASGYVLSESMRGFMSSTLLGFFASAIIALLI